MNNPDAIYLEPESERTRGHAVRMWADEPVEGWAKYIRDDRVEQWLSSLRREIEHLEDQLLEAGERNS